MSGSGKYTAIPSNNNNNHAQWMNQAPPSSFNSNNTGNGSAVAAPTSTSKYSKTAPRTVFNVSSYSSSSSSAPASQHQQQVQQTTVQPPPSLPSLSRAIAAVPQKFSFRGRINNNNNNNNAAERNSDDNNSVVASAASVPLGFTSAVVQPATSIIKPQQQQAQQQNLNQRQNYLQPSSNSNNSSNNRPQLNSGNNNGGNISTPSVVNNNNNRGLVNSTTGQQHWWRGMFQQSLALAVATPNPDRLPITTRKRAAIASEFSGLVDSLQTRQRTALLRRRSLDDYAKALRDVADDPGAKRALELWQVLEETSSAINNKLRDIRNKLEQQHAGADELLPAAAAASASGRFSFRNYNSNSNKRGGTIAPLLGEEITEEGAVALLESSGEFEGQLMPFQKQSLAFFLNLASRGAHGILADEPGLGKTCSSIALVVATRQLLRNSQQRGNNNVQSKRSRAAGDDDEDAFLQTLLGPAGKGGAARGRGRGAAAAAAQQQQQQQPAPLPPSIVVAPLSTAATWTREFQTFAPSLRVGVIGSVESEERAQIFKDFFREGPPLASGKRRGRRTESSSQSSSSSSSSQEETQGGDNSSSSGDDESGSQSSDDSSSSSDNQDDDDSSNSAPRGRGRGRGGRGGGRGGGASRGRGRGAAAASAPARAAATIARLGYGFDVLVVPHHFFSNHRIVLSRQYVGKLSRTPWLYCIVDEAHRIKNEQAILTQTLQGFSSVSHRLVLTGTPLQNNLGELWTLLSFLLPEVFCKAQFESLFKSIAEIHEVPNDDDDDPDDEDSDGNGDDNDDDNDDDAAPTKTKKARGKPAAKKSTRNKKAAKKPKSKNSSSSSSSSSSNSAIQKERARASAEERQFLLCRKIHDILLPLMVRREKREVIDSLPDVTEWVVVCPPTALQKFEANRIQQNQREAAAIGAAVDNNSADDDEDDDGADKLLLASCADEGRAKAGDKSEFLNVFIERRLSSHPFLLLRPAVMHRLLYDESIQQVLHRGSGKMMLLDLFLRFIDSYNTTTMAAMKNRHNNNSNNNNNKEDAPSSSPAFRPHKVLIFSQWTQLLDLVETHCGWGRNWPVQRLDGTTSGRTELLENFRTDDNQFIFLLSKGAGGVGLNLQSADTVVLLDVDYNPACDAQSIARAYRVGQDRDVLVLRLMSDSGSEMAMLNIAKKKQELEGRIIRAAKADMKTVEEERDQALRQMVFTTTSTAAAAAAAARAEDGASSSSTTTAIAAASGARQEAAFVAPALAGGLSDYALVSRFNFSGCNNNNSNSSSSSSSNLAQVRLALVEQILRFFPRNDSEREHLCHLVGNTDFLDEALEALRPSAVPNPPQCLRIEPKRQNYKNRVYATTPDKEPKELGMRAARMNAEANIERLGIVASSDDDSDEDS